MTIGNLARLWVAALLTTQGAIVIVLARLRSKTDTRGLVSLGVLAALYGVRLLTHVDAARDAIGGQPIVWLYVRTAITYSILIPGIFCVEQYLGRGVYQSIRRLWQIQAIYAVAGITIDLLAGRPETAMPLNSPLVLCAGAVLGLNLWRLRGHFDVTPEVRVVFVGVIAFALFALNENVGRVGFFPHANIEPIGVVIFVSCLGYFVAVRTFRNEQRLLAVSYELRTAQQIQASILPAATPQVDGLHIAARYVPMTEVAGDFYDFLPVDRARAGILVADVSGHGVPAALVASMVKVAVAAQADRASDPGGVLAGINQILCGSLERTFVTALYVFVDVDQRTLTYANAGHPPLLCRRAAGEVLELRDNGIMLGHFPSAEYSNTVIDLQPGDRVLLYTDGVLEARNPADEFFDDERLKEFLARGADRDRVDSFADSLIARLGQWSGKRAGAPFDDDVTVVVIDWIGR